MGSIRSSRIAVPLTVSALALLPAAGAHGMPLKDYSQNGATGDFAAQRIYKDYSKNGATGDYTPAVKTAVPSVVVAPHEQNSFSWSAAAIGAASTLLLVLLAGVTSRQVRRRRISAPSPARPTAA
jgi:hypothetical protein